MTPARDPAVNGLRDAHDKMRDAWQALKQAEELMDKAVDTARAAGVPEETIASYALATDLLT